MRQNRSHAGILHPHLDGDRPAVGGVLSREFGQPIAHGQSEPVVHDHRDKNSRSHGFEMMPVKGDDTGDNGHDR